VSQQSHTTIGWKDWCIDAFDEARDEDKLILLSITASWCHWCHVMDRTTYSDPIVMRIIEERFVPIRVDGDRRPDIQKCYLLGGWPTTAILTPDGKIVNGWTYLPPDALITMLCETNIKYHERQTNPILHIKRNEERWANEIATGETDRLPLDAGLLSEISDALLQEFDPWHGGFGTEPKFPYPDAIKFALLQFRRNGRRDMLEVATKTLDGMAGIYDDVWGGFYRYSEDGQWTKPHYEKMLYIQAGLLDDYLDGYEIIKKDAYSQIAMGIRQYVEHWLSDTQKGGFYASQDADVRGQEPSSPLVPGEEYYTKNEQERLRIGIPQVDKTVFTDWNAMMVSAYLHFDQIIGDSGARNFAFKTLDRLLSENLVEGKMCHYVDDIPCVLGMLSDQVYFAHSLIDAYQVSRNGDYLEHAIRLADYIVDKLEDKENGGFYFMQPDPNALGELKRKHKPLDENAHASRLLTRLHHHTGESTYLRIASRALQAIAHPRIVKSVSGAPFGVALDSYLNPP